MARREGLEETSRLRRSGATRGQNKAVGAPPLRRTTQGKERSSRGIQVPKRDGRPQRANAGKYGAEQS